MIRSVCSIAVLTLAATSLSAQKPTMASMPGMHDMHHEPNAAVSATARRQIDSVAKAIGPLGAPNAATNSGFQPIFGWIPTMGVHWVARGQLLNGRQANTTTPSQLMFSKIGGRDSLVGAAYGYFTATADTVRPALFDGAPAWHEHPDLAPMGGTLVMLHVWFVPSPDGPFAGTNPNLPFWAVGLAAPDSVRMRDSAFKARVYRASLALAELVDSTSVLSRLERRPDVRAAVAPYRDSIRAVLPEFLAAQKVKDAARWDRAATKAAAQWDAIYSAYLASARTADGKQRIERYVAMLLGRHEH
jgi:hypothetical protein